MMHEWFGKEGERAERATGHFVAVKWLVIVLSVSTVALYSYV